MTSTSRPSFSAGAGLCVRCVRGWGICVYADITGRNPLIYKALRRVLCTLCTRRSLLLSIYAYTGCISHIYVLFIKIGVHSVHNRPQPVDIQGFEVCTRNAKSSVHKRAQAYTLTAEADSLSHPSNRASSPPLYSSVPNGQTGRVKIAITTANTGGARLCM